MPNFTPLDYAALGWFLACWAGYALFADHSRWSARSVTAMMNRYRLRWMQEMLRRGLRMVDTGIIGNFLTGIGFFASTTILVIAGLFAMLGAAETALAALTHLPFAVPTGRAEWELKVLLLIVIFIYAFFKFAWAFRLSNYCSILIGAAPYREGIDLNDDPAAADHAVRAAGLVGRVAHHMNRGIRAYFFALAALGWFIPPALFIAATGWVIAVLYRREFRSHALRLMREERLDPAKAPFAGL